MKKYKQITITAVRGERELDWDGYNFVNDADVIVNDDVINWYAIVEPGDEDLILIRY